MKKLFENWRKNITEAEYEPGRAVADIDTGEERMSPEALQREEFKDLADKFNVKLEFAMRKGELIAKVTLQGGTHDGEVMRYHDPEDMYQDLAKYYEMNEGAELKIPVERYDNFKRKIEQWGMLFNKFADHAQDLGHPEHAKAAAPKLLQKVNKLESELQKIMKEFDLNYKYYADERHAALKKLDQFDGDDEYFLENEGDEQ
jgi:hypothetical protein